MLAEGSPHKNSFTKAAIEIKKEATTYSKRRIHMYIHIHTHTYTHTIALSLYSNTELTITRILSKCNLG